MTDTGSVAVVAKDAASPFAEPRAEAKGGDLGVGICCSEAPLLKEPAIELVVLGGALESPVAPL